MSFLSSLAGITAPKGTEASRRYSLLLWGYSLVCITSIGGFIAMQRGKLSADLKPFAVLGAFTAGIGAFVTFRQGTAAYRAERSREERQVMLLIMAGELNKQDDAALERISRQRGMAGEAASWILAERLRKRRGESSPERTRPAILD